MTAYAWRTFALDRLEALPLERNTGSIRVLQKAGYVFEGRLRDRVRKDGELMADLMYAAYRSTRAHQEARTDH